MKLFSTLLLGLAVFSSPLYAEPKANKCTCVKCECTYDSHCGCMSEKTQECPKKLSSEVQKELADFEEN